MSGDREKQPSERREDGLQDILRSSSRLMAREGFHGTSMRALSRATGRSLSGLYYYFESKEDLLYLVNFHGFTTLNQTWERMAAAFDTPEQRLYGFVYLHTHNYVANMDEMRVMNWGTQELEPERAETIRLLKDRYTADARAIVKAVYRSATGRSIGARRLSRLTYLLFGMMNWIFGWYTADEHGSVDELIRDIYRTFMHGIDNGAGDTRIDAIERVVRDAFREHSASSLWESAANSESREVE
jgi:AcrR family transcriptional regulator